MKRLAIGLLAVTMLLYGCSPATETPVFPEDDARMGGFTIGGGHGFTADGSGGSAEGTAGTAVRPDSGSVGRGGFTIGGGN